MAQKAENYIGRKYGNLTVISLHHIDTKGRRYWLCQCECGNTRISQGADLKSGKTKSCGCRRKVQRVGEDKLDKRLADVHHCMLRRCYNSTDSSYPNYGGKGITVCEEWHSLKNFRIWAYNNGYQEGLTIDRIDGNKNYEPSNCRWVDWYVQANNKCNNHRVKFNGEEHTISEWARIIGIGKETLRNRILKWGIEKALTTPLMENKSHKRT